MSDIQSEIRPNFRPPSLMERIGLYLELIRFHRPIGTLLLLWPALWGLWIAGGGSPPWPVVLIFVLGVFLMRSAGCAINDYADRNFDGSVERTRNRPLATGAIQPIEAIGVFVVLSLCAFGLVLFLNTYTILMSFVAVTLAALYPFMKRHTHFPQLFLGMAFGWAVPMAFTAINESIPSVAWLIFAATVIWALIYDTEYAMVDRDDDLKIGIKSTAIFFGEHDRTAIGILQAVMLALLVWSGMILNLGPWYYLGLAGALGAAVRQQWLIRRRDKLSCFKAFLNNNIYGMLIFAGIFVDYLTGK